MTDGNMMNDADLADSDAQGKEIYTYSPPCTIFAMAWSHR